VATIDPRNCALSGTPDAAIRAKLRDELDQCWQKRVEAAKTECITLNRGTGSKAPCHRPAEAAEGRKTALAAFDNGAILP
jgi:hypothetical protein